MYEKPKSFEVDSLIYQNINSYRLHADNLRFSLFTGYFAAIATAIYYFTSVQFKMAYCVVVLIVSILFMLIIAIQNWFYILFAQYMNDCEKRLVNGLPLTTMHDFSVQNGKNVRPSHPAFDFIMFVFSLLEGYLLYLVIINGFAWNENLMGNIYFKAIVFISSCGVNLAMIIICYRNWDKFIYKFLIKKTSSLFTGESTINKD